MTNIELNWPPGLSLNDLCKHISKIRIDDNERKSPGTVGAIMYALRYITEEVVNTSDELEALTARLVEALLSRLDPSSDEDCEDIFNLIFTQDTESKVNTLIKLVQIKTDRVPQIVRSQCLTLWKSLYSFIDDELDVVLAKLIGQVINQDCTQEQLNSGWVYIESVICVAMMVGCSEGMGIAEQVKSTLINWLSMTNNNVLISTILISMSYSINVTRPLNSQDTFERILDYVTHPDRLVCITALEAIVPITDQVQTLEEMDKETHGVQLYLTSEKIIATLKKCEPLFDEEHSNANTDVAFKYLCYYDQFQLWPTHLAKRCLNCLPQVFAIKWLERAINVTQQKHIHDELMALLTCMFQKRTKLKSTYTFAIFTCLNEAIRICPEKMTNCLELFVDYAFGRIERFLMDAREHDIEDHFRESSILQFINFACSAVTKFESERVVQWLLPRKEKIKGLAHNCLSPNVPDAARDFIYHFYGSLLEKELVNVLYDDPEEFIKIMMTEIVPMSVNHILKCRHHSDCGSLQDEAAFTDCQEYFLVNDGLCVLIFFLKGVIMPHADKYLSVFSQFYIGSLLPHTLEMFRRQDVDPLSLCNFAHLISVLFFVFGDVVANQMHPFVYLGMLDVLYAYKILCEKDNVEIIQAMCYMIESNLINDVDINFSTISRIMDNRAEELVILYPDQKCLLKRAILSSMVKRENVRADEVDYDDWF
ncbi:hypothetical protein AKO1_010811 [Acrasis kona]|uniref:Uncharacterized protein n=1 Tax=Acrasis kona TaxID=1008807 RepID=A0AAW2YMJ9_9EUKA